jgi:hypothetical protein
MLPIVCDFAPIFLYWRAHLIPFHQGALSGVNSYLAEGFMILLFFYLKHFNRLKKIIFAESIGEKKERSLDASTG